MLYPQNGSIAIGSRRTCPTAPVAAAVVSEAMVAPTYTPWTQSNAWNTSGIVSLRRPPKMIALIGTPSPFSTAASRTGLFFIGTAKRLLGCAAFSFESGDQSLPFQSITCDGGAPSLPSHQTSPSAVSATFVNSVSCSIEFIACGCDL